MRKVLAVLVSGALLCAGVNAAAWAQSPSAPQQKVAPAAAAPSTAKQAANATPLAPGAAAGIRQAQGSGERVWNIVGIGFMVGVAGAMIFVGGDDSDGPATTGTGS